MQKRIKKNSGFTLVEVIIGVTVFSIIVVAVYGAYMSIFDAVKVSRAKIEAVSLMNEQLEIVRNLPYSSVGIYQGIPSGVLTHVQTFNRNGIIYNATTTVRNVDDPFDGTLGGTPNDLSPADFKTVEIEVDCPLCKNFTPLSITTRVAPKNLETASTNGALFIKVFDANGNAVPDASVHVENNQVTPPIRIDDVTNNSGMLQIVDAKPGVNAYEITVTKSGYSTDKTYPITVSNPNPTKPHATVVLQQVTQISFVIDKVSTLNLSSITKTCAPVPSIDLSLKGSKQIGSNPVILKYDQTKTIGSSGTLTLNNMEWDAYSLAQISSTYDIVGINPPSPFSLNPNSTQNVQLVVAPKNPNTLLLTVVDSSTNLPLSGVTATLTKSGYSSTNISGQGYITQTDWSGGSGQSTTTDSTKYLSSDGNVETNDPAGDIKLKKIVSDYLASGTLTSSSFDLGLPANFQKISWNPVDQPAGTGNPNVRVQIATNNDGNTWNFTGPDGTGSTYYTTSNQNIHSSNDNKQYLRYKLFLNTASTTYTPNISDISLTFTSSCLPPGQTSWSGLTNGVYVLTLNKSGYSMVIASFSVNSPWQHLELAMTPN